MYNYSLLIRKILVLFVYLTIIQIASGQQTKEIHKAVTSGDLDKVRELIDADSTLLESKDKNGNTPINLACLHGFTREPDIAEFLIKKGANIKTKNNEGFTPLHGACSFAGFAGGGDFDLVQLLLAKGSEVNAKDKYGNTPLHASIGSINIARFLIKHGADVNATANDLTVLHLSLTYELNDEMSKLLIECGVKANQKDKLGNTELHLAAMRGFANLIPLMVKNGSDVNTLNNSNHTALYYAAKHGYSLTAKALIDAGADESSIVESNYGKAPQLSAKIKKGEAYLWYLKIGGYVIKTKNHLLILPQIINIGTSTEASLVNGQLNPNELAGQNIVLLSHFPRGDFLSMDESKLAKLTPKPQWVFYSANPTKINKNIQGLPPYQLISLNESISIGDIKVHTTPPKKGRGVGFLFEVDGLKIFNCLSYASTNKPSMIEEYHNGIDSMKRYGPIDIAILRVRSDMGNIYEPYLYLIDHLSPKTVYLTEGIVDPEEYSKCANFLKSRNIQVEYPETNAVAGDRFHFISNAAK